LLRILVVDGFTTVNCGNETVKLLPRPFLLTTLIVPRCSSTKLLTMAKPSPEKTQDEDTVAVQLPSLRLTEP
jgi:hypothetical protein